MEALKKKRGGEAPSSSRSTLSRPLPLFSGALRSVVVPLTVDGCLSLPLLRLLSAPSLSCTSARCCIFEFFINIALYNTLIFQEIKKYKEEKEKRGENEENEEEKKKQKAPSPSPVGLFAGRTMSEDGLWRTQNRLGRTDWAGQSRLGFAMRRKI